MWTRRRRPPTSSTRSRAARSTSPTSSRRTPRPKSASPASAPSRTPDPPGASVAEVGELEGDAEVLLLQLPDDVLQRVALLAGDAQLVALHLVLDALQADALDVLADLAGLLVADADVQR